MTALEITVRCVACRHTMTVGPEQRDVPMCPKCLSPMVAVSASGSRAPSG